MCWGIKIEAELVPCQVLSRCQREEVTVYKTLCISAAVGSNGQFKHHTYIATQTQTERDPIVNANPVSSIFHTLISHWLIYLGYAFGLSSHCDFRLVFELSTALRGWLKLGWVGLELGSGNTSLISRKLR